MSLIELAGFPVLSGSIALGLTGAWVANLVVDVENASDVTGSVKLTVGDTELTGTATPKADEGDQVTVLVVAGAGGLNEDVKPQGYNQDATYRTVLEQALQVGSESLSDDSDSAVLNTTSRWARFGGTVADAVRSLVKVAGCTWRVLDDGKVWVGTDDWAEVDPEHTVVSEDKTRMVVAVETLEIRPGKTFRDEKISEAVYRFDGARIRAHLRWDSTKNEAAAMIGEIVRRDVMPAVDASAIYAYEIQSQESDGTLNVKSTDARMPDLDKVPVRHGLMGLTENKVNSGTAYLTHEGGHPAKPRILAVAPSSTKTIVLEVTEKLEIKLGSNTIKVSSSEIEITAGQSIKVGTASVQCGGTQALTKNLSLISWGSQVATAIGSLGGSCPPYTDPGTTVLQGS